MDNINMKLLAEKLNVSISTVSKAFQDSYDISEETKARILSLAAELNYQPNPSASSLRTQKTKTIALIIPEIANNFFALAINGIESIAQKYGYHVLIYLTHEDDEKELAFTKHLSNGRVDGILMSLSGGSSDDAHLKELIGKDIPIVFFDRVYEDEQVSKVTTNDKDSAYLATTHLIQQGCRRIAHLFYSKNLSIVKKRKEGYLQALSDAGFEQDDQLLVGCTDTDGDPGAIRQMLQALKPDGIFSAFEKLAMQSYEACNELKLRIPEDIKIASFSNLAIAPLLNPSLTTVTQPAYEIGEKAASILFEALRKKTARISPGHIMLQSVLHERDSSRK